LEARRLHLEEQLTIQQIADHYDATTEAVRLWLILAKKHTLPDLDDKQAWFDLIVTNLGARLEDAKDTDAKGLAQQLAQMLGVGSREELRAYAIQVEEAKVRLVAERLGAALETAGVPVPQRRQVLEALTA
jgi:transposase-like protein